jgi:hypothetical protein
MIRRRGRRTALALLLVVALGGLPGLAAVTGAFQTGEIFSPASGHAQVIAQGVAALPAEAAWRAVFHSVEPGEETALPAGGPGFLLVDTGGVLLGGAGAPVLLAPSEAAFHGETATRLTPVGERPAGLFTIDLVAPAATQDAGAGIPVFASEPFSAPAGARDVDLVRDLLEPGEATTVIGNESPVLLLVTLGAVQVEATDGSSATLRVGEAGTFSGDVVVTAGGQAPSTFVAAVIGREAPLAVAATPGSTPVAAVSGSVQLTVYACPPAVTPAEASAETCLREPEAVALTLSTIDGPELRDVGPSREREGLPTWAGLPAGEYALQATGFAPGFGRFFVPDLDGLAPGAENGFPAGVQGGYRIPIGGNATDFALDVFALAPSGEGTPAAAPITTPPATATAEATGTPGPTEIPSIFEIEPADPDATATPTPTPRPAPQATATPRATARPIVTSTAVAQPRLGSVEVRVFGCLNPIETFDPASCVQALDGYDIRLIDENGEIIGLDEATVNDDGSITWEDVPLGSYLVQQPVLLPGATTYYVPGLPLADDGTGYVVTIDRETPVAAINIFSLPPSIPPTVAPAAQTPLDTDADGLPDVDETGIHGTDPANPDSDADGVGDGTELARGTNPLVADSAPPPAGDGDSDADRLSDANEASLGTDPTTPDSDGDGYYDGDEVNLGTNPLDASSVPVG